VATQKELRSYPSPEIQRAVTIYSGMANAATNETTRLFPTPEQALVLFDRLVIWRPQIEKDNFFGMASNNRKQLTKSIGNAISYAIVPALSREAITAERFEQLQAFYSQLDRAITVVPAFVYFAHLDEHTAMAAEKIIRKALQGREADEVSYAALALEKWVELPEATGSSQIKSLTSKLITIIESGRTVGLQKLLGTAGELFKKQLLLEEHVATLIEALLNAFNAAEYSNIEPNSQEAINASSIREACAKLANILVISHPNYPSLEDLLKESKADALPEVRFANNT
jgi:hypothetical protein